MADELIDGFGGVVDRLQTFHKASGACLLLFPLERAHEIRQGHLRQQPGTGSCVERDAIERPIEAIARRQQPIARNPRESQLEPVDQLFARLGRWLALEGQ